MRRHVSPAGSGPHYGASFRQRVQHMEIEEVVIALCVRSNDSSGSTRSGAASMSLMQDDHVVQAFAADAPNQPFTYGFCHDSAGR